MSARRRAALRQRRLAWLGLGLVLALLLAGVLMGPASALAQDPVGDPVDPNAVGPPARVLDGKPVAPLHQCSITPLHHSTATPASEILSLLAGEDVNEQALRLLFSPNPPKRDVRVVDTRDDG